MTHKKHTVSKIGLSQLADNLIRIKEDFTIKSTAGNMILNCGELIIKTKRRFNLSNKVFVLFKSVEKSVNEYIIKNNFDVPEIKREYSAKYINKRMYNDLPDGFEFLYVDIKHCYWRIAYLMGILNESTYKQYKDSVDFKLARNIALSIITSKRIKEFYKNGKLILKISCENPHYKIIYSNIRYTAYNFSGRVKEKLDGRCISYYVDGFMILPEDFEIVKKEMKKAKMYYSVTKCKKIDSKRYWYRGFEKKNKMKNRDGLENSDNWETPDWLYNKLNKEFNFDYDPCPINADFDGLKTEWGKSNFINPPYNRIDKPKFIQKAFYEWKKGKTCVLLIPSATGTKQFHELILPNAEIRFLKGRIAFKGYNSKGEYITKGRGKHDSMIVIFRHK